MPKITRRQDKLIAVLNDGDTFTVLDGSSVRLMDPSWKGYDVDPDHVVDEFYLDSPADLRRLAALLERGA